MLTPREVRDLLDRYGLAPRRAAGQNFVVDANTVRRIVRHAGIGADDTVLEIGPGLGSLTIALAGIARRVVAVEIDAGLVRALAETVGDLANVEIVHADALAVDLGALGDGPAVVVANLPYNVATPLVMRALADARLRELFVMVQREVGERWGAHPGDPSYSGVSLKVALLAEARIELAIPRTVFLPVPNVDSVMVRLTRRPGAPVGARRDALLGLVDLVFATRRKTLRTTLRRRYDAGRVDAALTRAGIEPSARPGTLDVPALERLADGLGI